MGMDWANERYVRLYVRETPDQALWCWQALAIWPWLVVRAERSGELSTRKGAAGLAALLRIPLEVVEPGIADLLAVACGASRTQRRTQYAQGCSRPRRAAQDSA